MYRYSVSQKNNTKTKTWMQILWKTNIEAITSKANFLKQLNHAAVPQTQLLHFYTGVIRPVLEYATPVWNHLITKAQIDQTESIAT